MIRIALCDDSPAFLNQTKFIIEHWEDRPANIFVDLFEDGDALLESHTKNPYDIILLDVVMPLFNGIQVAKEIRQNNDMVKIVFLTTSIEYAIESYSVKASNYLLKPVDPNKLFSCLNELLSDIYRSSKCITVKDSIRTYKINISNIEYIESQGKLVVFSLADGRKISTIASLYTFEEELGLADGFFKCHRSYLVNIYYVDAFSSKEIVLHSKTTIPIARNRHKEFEDIYFKVIFGKAGEDK